MVINTFTIKQESISLILHAIVYFFSKVYNWTVDDVLDWLVNDVQLGQYSEQFRINAVDGKTLPRLASTSTYVTKILGIKNAVHSKKVTVKAMDVVLFGSSNSMYYVTHDSNHEINTFFITRVNNIFFI